MLGSCSCIEILAGHVVGREGIEYSNRTKCQRRKAYGGTGTEKKEDLEDRELVGIDVIRAEKATTEATAEHSVS